MSPNQVKKIQIDVSESLTEQFSNQLEIPLIDRRIRLNSSLGKGEISIEKFPNQLELYRFHFKLNFPVHMQSFNPLGSDWLLLNVNLSKATVSKKVNDQQVDIQKFLPSGMLFYTPKTEVESLNPPGKQFEIALIRFHKSFLNFYLEKEIDFFINTENALIYEDLDPRSERFLMNALSGENKLQSHGNLLNFLSIFIEKLKVRESEEQFHNLHPDDVKGLFLASAKLRNPLVENVPSIDDLVKTAGMGATKFKTCFKQIFGLPPIKYHQKIKMEYARRELENGQKTAGVLSYELGYSHPSKFTVAFKKQFGKLPSEI